MKNSIKSLRVFLLGCLLLLLLASVVALKPGHSAATAATAAQSTTPSPTTDYFGLIGLLRGQSIRVNVVNTGDANSPTSVPPGPCHIEVKFIDADGMTLAMHDNTLTAVQSQSVDFNWNDFHLREGRGQLRIVVKTSAVPGAVAPGPCFATLEVLSTDNARTTSIVNPAVIRGFNPQPDPPAIIGR